MNCIKPILALIKSMMCINIHSEKIIGSQLNFIDKTFKKCAFLNVLSVFDFILPNFGDSFQE